MKHEFVAGELVRLFMPAYFRDDDGEEREKLLEYGDTLAIIVDTEVTFWHLGCGFVKILLDDGRVGWVRSSALDRT